MLRRPGHLRAVVIAFAAGVAGFGAFLWLRPAPEQESPIHSIVTPVGAMPELAPSVFPPLADPANRGTDSSISDAPRALTLVAIYPGAAAHKGMAALGTDPSNPQTYEVGSILANGAVVEAIHADRIVLSLNGTRIELLGNLRAAPHDVTIGGPGTLQPVDTVPNSHEQMSRYVRSQLVFEGSELVGFRVVPGSQPEGLDWLELMADDVIRSVEGKSVTRDADWLSVEQALNSGKSISVVIERNGGLLTLSLDGARLAKAAESARNAGVVPMLGS